MNFSKHVGLEPATDLKRRIESLCREAGFEVAAATMHLARRETMEESGRFVLVWIHEPGWVAIRPEHLAGTNWDDHPNFQMELRALIGVDGTFDGTVHVSCSATDEVGDVWAPTLRSNVVKLT